MDKKIWVNRVLVAFAVIVIALLAFAAQYFGVLDIKGWIVREPEVDPIAMIEENGHVDVLYYGIGEHESNLLGNTPVAALGILYYAPTMDDADAEYHIHLTDTGWEIVKGEYEWSPDVEESYQDELHTWNFRKWVWYRDQGGMLKPGQFGRVYPALYDLLDWYQDRAFRDFLYRVFVWAESSGIEWNALEIDFVKLNGPAVLPGYTTQSGTGYVTGFWPSLNGTLVMFKTRKEQVFTPDGHWAEIRRNPVQEALEAGELTEEAFDAIKEANQLQPVGAMTFFGPRQYSKGFNHPWQGRELAQPGAT